MAFLWFAVQRFCSMLWTVVPSSFATSLVVSIRSSEPLR